MNEAMENYYNDLIRKINNEHKLKLRGSTGLPFLQWAMKNNATEEQLTNKIVNETKKLGD